MDKCVLCNVHAGTSHEKWHTLKALCEQAGCEFRTCETNSEIQQLTGHLVGEGIQRIIVAGGDGTVSYAIRGLSHALDSAELAIVPLGSGNDLARGLGLLNFNLKDSLGLALEGNPTPIDLIKISDGTSTYMINAASGGFGGEVTSGIAPESKRRWGGFAYWITAMSKLADLKPYHVTLELDDDKIDKKIYGLAIANGKFVGGGFEIAPDALLTDGKLDVITIPVLPTVELLAAGINYFLGRDDPEGVQTYQSRRVYVRCAPTMQFSVDGEPLRRLEATFELVPGAVKIVVP